MSWLDFGIRHNLPPSNVRTRIAVFAFVDRTPYTSDFHFGILSHSSIHPTGSFATAILHSGTPARLCQSCRNQHAPIAASEESRKILFGQTAANVK